MTLKLDVWPWKIIGHLLYTTSSFVYNFKSIGEFKLKLQSGNAQFGSKLAIFFPVWPWNLMDDLGKQQGTSSIPHQALCIISNPSVNWNWSFSPETLNSGQNRQFFVLCDLEIWWMTLVTIGHLFCATSSFVQYFLAIAETNWSYSPETPNLGQILQFLEPCDLEIWQMTLQNNRAPLLCYFKLCAPFHTHWWIKIWVTVRKRSIQVKIDNFFSRVT